MAGSRVVRGPDWKWGNQDGGDGNVGTVEDRVGKMVRVKWDNGNNNNYRVGADGAHDLALLDNGPAGVKHDGVQCDACRADDIRGVRWKCLDCNNYNMCTECYGNDEHDTDHAFKLFDKPGRDGVNVGKRSSSEKTQARGIYPAATVVRGPDWNKGNEDGGDGNTGVVHDIGYVHQSNMDKAKCIVMWENDYEEHTYRLGLGGKVDVKCTTPAIGWSYYKQHLPVLHNRSLPTFKIGDKLIISKSVSTTKDLQTDHGGWNKYMEHLISTKTAGTMREIDSDGDIRVDFGSDVVFLLNPAVCEKVRRKDVNAEVKTPLDNIDPDSSRSDQASLNIADCVNYNDGELCLGSAAGGAIRKIMSARQGVQFVIEEDESTNTSLKPIIRRHTSEMAYPRALRHNIATPPCRRLGLCSMWELLRTTEASYRSSIVLRNVDDCGVRWCS